MEVMETPAQEINHASNRILEIVRELNLALQGDGLEVTRIFLDRRIRGFPRVSIAVDVAQ